MSKLKLTCRMWEEMQLIAASQHGLRSSEFIPVQTYLALSRRNMICLEVDGSVRLTEEGKLALRGGKKDG